MSQTINVNGESINYPETGDTNWGDEATQFAIQTSAALGKIGLASGTTVDITSTLDVTGATTLDSTLTVAGVTYLDDNTTANTPVLSFTGDTNTGIGRSAADTLDFITNGNSRFRIEPTGQIKAAYESTVGTGYNTTLHNGYLCRAWVRMLNTVGTISIVASGNISSVTDINPGEYFCNFTTAMPDANYVVSFGACTVAAINPNFLFGGQRNATPNTVNGFSAIYGDRTSPGSLNDPDNSYAMVFR